MLPWVKDRLCQTCQYLQGSTPYRIVVKAKHKHKHSNRNEIEGFEEQG